MLLRIKRRLSSRAWSAPSVRLRSVISITEPGPPAQEPSGRCTGIIQGAELPKLHPVHPVKNGRAVTSLGFPEWDGMKQASTGEQPARRTASGSFYAG